MLKDFRNMFLKFISILKQKNSKKITALLKCGHKLRYFIYSFYNNDGATPSNFRV